MQLLKLLLPTLFIISVVSSCSIEKRRYNSGYHISLKNKTSKGIQNKSHVLHHESFAHNNFNKKLEFIPVLKGKTFSSPYQATIIHLKELDHNDNFRSAEFTEKNKIQKTHLKNHSEKVNRIVDKKKKTTSVGGVLLILLSIILAFAGLIFILSFTFWSTPSTLITILLIIGFIAWLFGCYVLFNFGRTV